ncbi:MAG TPA: hypothetical protein PLP89_03825 [Synergistales bacterium]|nr:hypothetical protein [Synergistales bacterium]HRV71650.1 hypothetical protein [Thermovirgaceae bacterium]
MKIIRYLATGILIALAAAGTAFGDAAPDPLNSGLAPSARTHRVWMADEEVNIHLGEETVSVEAIFRFANLSEKKTTLEVGFPTDYRDDVEGLEVFVNGNVVAFREEKEKLFYPESIDEDGITVNWALWDMTFPGKTETELRVTYRVKPRKNHDYLITPYRDFIEKIVTGMPQEPSADSAVGRLLAGMETFSTGYILVTGSGWYGSIGEAVINVFHEAKGPGVIRWFHPEEDYRFLPDRLQWKFYYLDPTFNIELEFNPSFTLDEEISLVSEALASDGKNQGLKDLMNFLQELRGKMK